LFSGWGFTPGELTALPKPPAGKGERKGGEGEGREKEGSRKGREGKRGEVASS